MSTEPTGPSSNDAASSSDAAIKDPDEWVSGDEPMTAAQRSYLHTLGREAGVAVDDPPTKRDAAKMIEELQQRTGRGSGS